MLLLEPLPMALAPWQWSPCPCFPEVGGRFPCCVSGSQDGDTLQLHSELAVPGGFAGQTDHGVDDEYLRAAAAPRCIATPEGFGDRDISLSHSGIHPPQWLWWHQCEGRVAVRIPNVVYTSETRCLMIER